MKTTLLATSLLGISLIACSDEADIGVNSDPITCMTTPAADMGGSVDYNGVNYKFENASPSVTRDPNGGITTLSLWSSENPDTQRGNYMRFFFQCGQAEVRNYDVVSNTDQRQLTCPNEVSGAVLGTIEILPATDGVLIVDEMSSCLAGRFRVDLDSPAGGSALKAEER